jgi:hypothetical protein
MCIPGKTLRRHQDYRYRSKCLQSQKDLGPVIWTVTLAPVRSSSYFGPVLVHTLANSMDMIDDDGVDTICHLLLLIQGI